MVTGSKNIKIVALLLLCLIAASCASTSLVESWKEPENDKSYHHLLIIGISDSQQTRRIYEGYFAGELEKKNITATSSYTLISSKQEINRETVLQAIKGSSIDAVLVTYLVSADEQITHHDSPLNPSYSGTPDDNLISATLVASRGRTSSSEVVGLKNDLYDVQSQTLVWSARTKTVAPESIDHAITEVTHLLINELFSDNLLK